MKVRIDTRPLPIVIVARWWPSRCSCSWDTRCTTIYKKPRQRVFHYRDSGRLLFS